MVIQPEAGSPARLSVPEDPASPTESLGRFNDRWFGDACGHRPRQETNATCSDCAMCRSPGTLTYRPDTKCCTYWPVLPNYLVGEILSDEAAVEEASRTHVRRAIEADVAVPRGLRRPLDQEILYQKIGLEAFGQSRRLICPHFVDEAGGRCGIWSHRNSVCATWFCKFTRGTLSAAYWESVRALVAGVEDTVSLWCAIELGVPVGPSLTAKWRGVDTEPARDDRCLDGEPGPAQRAIWGRWYDCRGEFYRGCARLGAQLSWSDISRLGGIALSARAAQVADAFAALQQPAQPTRLRLGQFTVLGHSADTALVHTYRSTDPQLVGVRLLAALRHFSGQPLQEALDQVQREDGVELSADVLSRLVDFRFLVESNCAIP